MGWRIMKGRVKKRSGGERADGLPEKFAWSLTAKT